MNDFTKEELEIIMRLYEKCPPGTYIEDLGHFINKIQSMIDNYCEHKNSKHVSDIDYILICTKCSEITGFI